MNIIFPLAITMAFETPIYMLIKRRDMKLFLIFSLLNLILNPLMNIALMGIEGNDYYIFLAILEITTVLIESAVIYLFTKVDILKVFLISLNANALSLLIGIILFFVYQTRITIIVLTIIFFSFYLFFLLASLFASRSNRKKNDKDR